MNRLISKFSLINQSFKNCDCSFWVEESTVIKYIPFAMPEKEGKLIISNSLGQILYSKNLFSNEDALDLSGFAKGIYLITVLSSTQKLQSQFLKL